MGFVSSELLRILSAETNKKIMKQLIKINLICLICLLIGEWGTAQVPIVPSQPITRTIVIYPTTVVVQTQNFSTVYNVENGLNTNIIVPQIWQPQLNLVIQNGVGRQPIGETTIRNSDVQDTSGFWVPNNYQNGWKRLQINFRQQNKVVD